MKIYENVNESYFGIRCIEISSVSTFVYCLNTLNHVSISADGTLLRYGTHAKRNILPQRFTCKQIRTGSQVLPKKLSWAYLHSCIELHIRWLSLEYDARIMIVTRTTM